MCGRISLRILLVLSGLLVNLNVVLAQSVPASQSQAAPGPPPQPSAAAPQPAPAPGSASAANPGNTGPPAANPNPPQSNVAPTPIGSSASTPTSSISVNLTPFGGSPIASVPGLSVPVTLSSTAGFPSLTGYPMCVSQCLAIAASAANCSSVIAVNCYCASPEFAGAIVNCTARECIGNLDLSQNLAQQYCNLAMFPASLSFPTPPPTSMLPSTSIVPVTIITGTAPPGSSGAAKVWDGARGAALGVGMAIVGAFAGVVLVG
ncbi:hypothetical protein HYDPIDRAFT_29290 [Hydnomerulius pinastri MD-312]|uniref:CFEM domain-containing protein n=1 Tax=Hydnomerulius pinastri MD-312 TaxID=994086 RepID=A0A0C9W7Z1_9AGAM|nr:hypothetical protein HYDPIDRAFT_29290 [Hydnomerulius pinastri MD-312]